MRTGIKPTRFLELGYRHECPGLWRIVEMTDGKPMGPLYRTRLELLADLERFAREDYGCYDAKEANDCVNFTGRA